MSCFNTKFNHNILFIVVFFLITFLALTSHTQKDASKLWRFRLKSCKFVVLKSLPCTVYCCYMYTAPIKIDGIALFCLDEVGGLLMV
jgi:hypothetical protein